MGRFLAVVLTAAALLLDPVADRVLGGLPVRPDLRVATLVIAVACCPGAAAVVLCGLVGLIVDCLIGPQLGARAACFCLLAALGSNYAAKGTEGLTRRFALWWGIVFAAELCSRAIQYATVAGQSRPAAVFGETIASSIATLVLVGGFWFAAKIVLWRPRSRRTGHRVALAFGRSEIGF